MTTASPVQAGRTYNDALECLDSLRPNANTVEALRASGGKGWPTPFELTLQYLDRIGYVPEELNKLNVIHVTGTKGKGSTCAFVDSLLRHAVPQWKIGLYTSPHLVVVRERFRVNGVPITEESFAMYFFELWDRLEGNTEESLYLQRQTTDAGEPSRAAKLSYLQYLTLLAFHIFIREKVDATILEVILGGIDDSTNVVPRPVVTGVSNLGLDHTSLLGKTLEDIAWSKGAIFKAGVPAFTVPQPEEGLVALRQRAIDRKASKFSVISIVPELSSLQLGLAGKHQIRNANLAIHLVQEFISVQAPELITFDDGLLPLTFVQGLQNVRWPGRCQTITDPKDQSRTRNSTATWFLDGAHTVESLDCCQEWFVSPEIALRPSENPARRRRRMLLFNYTGERSGASLVRSLLTKTASQLQLHESTVKAEDFFDEVIFCTNIRYSAEVMKKDGLPYLKKQNELASIWRDLAPSFSNKRVHVLPSIEDSIYLVRSSEEARMDGDDLVEEKDVLVTGSLHLVGGVIEVAGLRELAL